MIFTVGVKIMGQFFTTNDDEFNFYNYQKRRVSCCSWKRRYKKEILKKKSTKN